MWIAPRVIPAAWLALAGLAGCHEPTSEGVREPDVIPAYDLAGKSCNAGATDPGNDDFTRIWPCGQHLRLSYVGFTDAAETAAVTGASEDWNEVLFAAQLNLPRFGTGTPSATITVRRLAGQVGGWCGTASKTAPYEITLERRSCGTSSLRGVAIQELSHVLGFLDSWDKKAPDSTLGHCSGRSYNGQVTGTFCQHEMETVYRAYGLRTGLVDYYEHIVTGLGGLQNVTIRPDGSATLSVTQLRFARANGSLCDLDTTQSCGVAQRPVTSSNVSPTWREAAGGQFITLNPSGASATVIAGSTEGTATVAVTATSTVYNIAAAFGDPGTGTSATVTVDAVAPAGRPTSLAASNITPTSALVTWTNGDASAGTTTVVQYRMTGQTAWITASGSGLPASQSSLTIAGLHCSTSYDVNVYHVKDGISSPWLTLTLFTTAACQVSTGIAAPTGFSERSCSLASGAKTYATYTVGWTPGANPGNSIYQIVSAMSNNPGSGGIVRTGAVTRTTDALGPYLVTSSSSPRYFWVRHANGAQASAWVALVGNPIEISQGCSPL